MASTTRNARNPNRGANGDQGSNWIRKAKRHRIYSRDSWRCVWCCSPVADGAAVTAGARERLATLDHVVSRARGGSNEASNLVTACITCNAERGDRSAIEFAFAKAEGEPGIVGRAAATLDRLVAAMGRELPAAASKAVA